MLETLRNDLLPRVQKPGQYLGNEWGSYRKDWDSAKSRIALIYPDLYELGMSNFGIKILYNIVNRHPDYLCDRAYAVMPDVEELLRSKKIPLWGWESNRALKDFDMLGFSLAYELCYSNVLNILDLAGIPLESSQRNDSHPIIFAGGPAVFNPEPMAEYIDFYIIGDGEELITEIQTSLIKSRSEGKSRTEILLDLAQLQGIYVPQFYKPDPENNYLAKPISDSIPFPVRKRVTQYLGDFNQPVTGPVPYVEAVQDKQVLEIRRGCDRGCRFCQVGYTYLPVRERSPEDLLRLSSEAVKKTGYNDFTLLSLSASDYTCLTEAAKAINDRHSDSGIGLSMPSQRADRFNVELADEISGARKSGMTFAPEAGTEKMRKIINKGLSEEEIRNAIQGTYLKGWNHIKLYFMIGLPFEDDSDLDGILDILTWSINMAREQSRIHSLRPLNITCTISTFVPKTFTAFQWFSQCSAEEFKRKQKYLIDGLYHRRINRNVRLNCTEPEIALIEAVLSRGDRRWGKVIRKLWESGSRLDSWTENFKIERWQQAALDCGLDLHEEAERHREPGSKQCWDVVTIGFTEKFLLDEWNKAIEVLETVQCTESKCHACGVCFNLDVFNIVTKDLSEKNPFVKTIAESSNGEIKVSDLLPSQFSRESASPSPRGNSKPDGSEFPLRRARSGERSGDGNFDFKTQDHHRRFRIQISKRGDLRFISHLDFQRLVERALRRSGLEIVHTNGFNQRIKVNWLVALPLFVESLGEYIELELADYGASLKNLKEILNQELPNQARIEDIEEIPLKEKLSTSDILETVYTARLIRDDQPLDGSGIKAFLDRGVIEIKKISKGKEKSKNLKEEIISMTVLDRSTLELKLKSTQRVDEVLTAFMPGSIWQVCKVDTVFNRDISQAKQAVVA